MIVHLYNPLWDKALERMSKRLLSHRSIDAYEWICKELHDSARDQSYERMAIKEYD